MSVIIPKAYPHLLIVVGCVYIHSGECMLIVHYWKPVIRRVPKSSPCAKHRAHGEESLCRGPNTEHTTKIKPTAEGGFAVCPNLGTRQNDSLPCASDRHTAKIGPRGQSNTVGQRRHILGTRRNLYVCRVPRSVAHGKESLPCVLHRTHGELPRTY